MRTIHRCQACHVPLASFGKRHKRNVHVCGHCLAIARHDERAIQRFRREEDADDWDIHYVRVRVRSAIYYAWKKSKRLAHAS